jgi:hypothetical protein
VSSPSPDEPLSQSSQIGRAAQTGGTPEGRRAADEALGRENDSDRWLAPREEDAPIENRPPAEGGREQADGTPAAPSPPAGDP